tara:strand:- start:179 stop:595 length:417 start_codon:yes stop_codon:yes gene_type:complete
LRVVFYGGRHFNDVHGLYEVFYKLFRGRGMAEMYLTDDPGAPELLARFGREQDLDVRVVPAPWLLFGNRAEGSRRRVLLESAPEMVVLLPGGRSVAHMADISAAAGLPVWDLRELDYIIAGDGRQIGERDVDQDELLF